MINLILVQVFFSHTSQLPPSRIGIKMDRKIQIDMNDEEDLGNHRFVLEEWCSSCSESEDDG